MARLARVQVVDVPYHVTQRGNARQSILACDSERRVYLDLLRQYAQLHDLSLLGYCLMSNHVHLVVVPRKPDALALALKHAHGRYACYWNAHHTSSGHVWQGRYYSCPLDAKHLWEAMRYAELNPVRAGMVGGAAEWPWSSAAAHCGAAPPDVALDMNPWRKRWEAASWRAYLTAAEGIETISALRQSTHTGRPLGSPEFITALEHATQRRLAPQKGGRPQKPLPDARQTALGFDS